MDTGSKRSPTRAEIGAALVRLAASVRSATAIAQALAEIVRELRSCAWLDGDLRVELAHDDAPERGAVVLDLYVDRGAVRERALPTVTLAVALDEIDVVLQAAPELFAPLRMRHHKGKLVFTQKDVVDTLPPPQLEVAAESLTPLGDTNPHEKPTVKRPAYVVPEALRSGSHPRKSDT